MAKGNINNPEKKEKYENPSIPRMKSYELANVLKIPLKRGNAVIVDGLKYHFNGKDKLYIDKNAAKSADIQGKKYKEMIDLKELQERQQISGRSLDVQNEDFARKAKSKFDEIFNSILHNSGTDLRARDHNVNVTKLINNTASIDIERNDGKKGTLSIFYNPHIDYRKIEIWRNADSDEFYCLSREGGEFELDSNDGGRMSVDEETVYNEILPVFSEYLQNKK